MAIKRVFSLQEAAEYINVGISTLHIAIAPNTKQTENVTLVPPHFERVGKRGTVIFLREDLDAWKRVNSKTRRKGGPRRKSIVAPRLTPEVVGQTEAATNA